MSRKGKSMAILLLNIVTGHVVRAAKSFCQVQNWNHVSVLLFQQCRSQCRWLITTTTATAPQGCLVSPQLTCCRPSSRKVRLLPWFAPVAARPQCLACRVLGVGHSCTMLVSPSVSSHYQNLFFKKS